MLTFLGIVYAIVCVLLVIMVMLQSGKAGGMGIFGGGGGSSSLGSQGGDIMTKITTVLGVLFFVIAIAFAYIVSRDNTVSKHDQAATAAKNKQLVAPGEGNKTNAAATGTNAAAAGKKAVPATATNAAKP